MKPFLLALLLTFGSFAAYGQAPDCQFTQTFTATGYGVTVPNRSFPNLQTQCTTWRLSYYADGMTALSIQVEGAPDASGAAGTFAAVANTACSATQQPPCILDGANPLTDPNNNTVAFRGYYAWLAVHVTVFTPTGATGLITARMYGYKGSSPSAAARQAPGSGTFVTLSGDATSTATGGATTVVGINGGSVPASANVLGSNASSQPIAATATNLSALNYVAGGGTAQVQTATLSPAVTALTNGLQVCWLPIAANTAAAPTLQVNAIAAKPVTKFGAIALVANDLITTATACAIYDGTEYQLQNPQTQSTAVLGSGTLNYFPKFTGTGRIGNSALVDDGTQIYTTTRIFGVGTATPGAPFEIAETPGNNPILIVRDTATAGSQGTGIGLYNNYSDSASRNWGISQSVVAYGDLAFLQSTAIGGNPFSAGIVHLYFDNNGNMQVGPSGFGTSNKSQLLPVFQTSIRTYDTSGTPSVNKWALYNDPDSGFVAGVGLSTSSFDLLNGAGSGYSWYSGTTNVDGTGAFRLMSLFPTTNSSSGILSIGLGPFDGATAGHFLGSSNGTQLAVNAGSGSTADLMNLEVAGVSEARITSTGLLTLAASTFVLGGHTCSIVATVLTCP